MERRTQQKTRDGGALGCIGSPTETLLSQGQTGTRLTRHWAAGMKQAMGSKGRTNGVGLLQDQLWLFQPHLYRKARQALRIRVGQMREA